MLSHGVFTKFGAREGGSQWHPFTLIKDDTHTHMQAGSHFSTEKEIIERGLVKNSSGSPCPPLPCRGPPGRGLLFHLSGTAHLFS